MQRISIISQIRNYEVLIGDIRQNFVSLLDIEKNYVVVTEKNIPVQYVVELTQSLRNCLIYTIEESREKIKTFSVVNQLISFLLEHNADKDTVLMALGGGVITDMVGFTAMVYKRGISYISIPTSLIAQVDASIGGKVAINQDTYKNVVGGIYPPTSVFIDPSYLATLADVEVKSGMVEVIKMAALVNKELFYSLMDRQFDLDKDFIKLLIEAVKIKKWFVEQDEFDSNIRQALNFGHTYGHAIELLANCPHGLAVAAGMCKESDNNDIKKCLLAYNIETNYAVNEDEVQKVIINDKKIHNGEYNQVVINDIGSFSFKKVKIGD